MKIPQATRHSGRATLLCGGLLALLLGGGFYSWHRSVDGPVAPLPESGERAESQAGIPDSSIKSDPEKSAALGSAGLVFRANHQIQELTPEVAGLPQNAGARYFLSNPGQDTTARFFGSGGVLLRSGLGGSTWQGSLQLSGGAGEWKADGCRIERAGDGLTEWYENKEEGIEHGFTLARQLDTTSETVTLNVRLEGLRAEIDPTREGDLRFIDSDSSTPVLGYRGLKVWDSTGRTLAAAMAPSAGGICFTVQAGGAVYPVTIDPVIVTLESKKMGPHAGASAGASVDISETLAVVGMPGANTAVATNAGAVAVFRKSGGSWLPEATLIDPSGATGDGFGNTVALGGTRIAVGAPYNDEGAATDAGSISVFQYSEVGPTWTQQYRRVNGTSQFGRSLAVDADVLVVGAPTAVVGSLASAGLVYLYELSTGTYLRALTSGTAVAGAQFGHAVAASSGRIAVGEPYVTNGRAWIFRPNLNTYLSTQLTTPTEVLSGEQFGHAVALSDDFAAVSAARRDGDRGKVYGYLRSGNVWSNTTAVTAPGATAWHHYGHSLDMTADFLAVGALWADPIVSGTTYFDAGSVYLYKKNGGTLDLRQTIVPSDRAASDIYGSSVALSSQYLIGGAPGVKSGAAANFGAAYIHAYQGTDDADTNVRNSGNLLASPPTAEQLVAIRSVAGKEGFRVSLSGSIRRLDAVDLPLPSPLPADGVYFPTTFDLNFRTSLADSASGQLIPLVGGGLTTQSVTMGAFTTTATGRQAVLLPVDRTLSLVPVDPSLVLPNRSYQITVTVDHHDGVATRVDYTRTFTNLEPISLNGSLRFGSIGTTFTAVANNPAAGSVNGSGGLFFLPLTLPAGAGRVIDRPAQIFGGGPLTVIYVSTGPQQGDLVVYAGTVQLTGAAEGSSSGVRWTRGPIVLGENGAVAQNFRVTFPAGLGLAQNATTGRLKSSALVNVSLSPDLQPVGSTGIYPTSGDVMYVVHERLPHRMETKGLSWDIDAGIFTPDWKSPGFGLKHVREDENEYLNNNGFPLVNGDDRFRMSNDRYLYGDATGQEIVIRTSTEGRALLDGTVELQHKEYLSHFPKGLLIPDGQTTVTFQSSQVASGTMVQSYINPIPLSYSTVAGDSLNCLNPALATRTVNFIPANETWQITPDGGLRTGGSIQSADVSWGLNASDQFTHTVQSVTTGVMHLAGTALSAGVYGPVPNDGAGYLPAAMLLSGHGSPADAALIERPFTKGYDSGADATSAELAAAGRADYPGFNFRVGTAGGLTAMSHLAGEDVGPYGLKAHGKYYLRRSGVTGVHDAVTADIAPLPRFYGYDMQLSQLTLSFLDTGNHDSVNTGSLSLPAPSGFSLAFKDLVFTSSGELERADFVNPGTKHLLYWDTDIQPASMEFASLDACIPGNAFLVLAVTAVMPAITNDPLQGRLGFKSDGTLVTASESGQSQVDSRFVLPSTIALKGVEGGVGAEGVEGAMYQFTPVTKAALNSYNPGESAVGFLSFAGALSVPFFEDMLVHIHATPSVAGSPNSLYHVMGGWSVTDPDGRLRNFFNDANFDSGNRGYPDAVPPLSVEEYRRNIRNEYQPVAHRNWRGITDLDYRLVWDAAGRTFVSGDDDDDHDQLLVLTVDHQVQKLTSRGCAITFGTGFTTPQLNVGALAAEALSGGLRDALPNPEDLLGGIDELEKLVTDRFERTIGAVLDEVLSTSADGIVDDLDAYHANLPAGAVGFSGLTTGYLNQRKTAIGTSIKGLGENGGAVFNQINAALEGAIDSCDLALEIIGTKDERQMILAVVKGLSEIGSEPISSVPDDVMVQAEDGLQQAQVVIEEAKARLQSLKSDAATVQRIQAAFTQAGDLAAQNAIARIVESYRAERDITGNYMSEFSRAEHKARVMALLRQSISGGALAEAVQPILRGTFSEIRSQFRGALDLMFAEVNRLLNRTLKELVDNGIAEFRDMAGASPNGEALGSTAAGVGDFCATARVDGYAQINGEEIKEIRLNSRLKMKLAASLTVDGWFQLLNLESGTPNSSGRPAGTVATEITVGASAQASFGPTSVAVSLEGRFSFGPNFNLVGLDGSFDLRATMPVKQASFDRFAAKFGFGGGVGYVSGLVEGSVYFVEAQGACFFGTTRNPQDLSLIDQDTRRLLTVSGVTNGLLDQPLTGIYTGMEGNISVNEFFGIPDSCFLSLKAHLGVANFCFFQNRPDGAYLIPGVRYLMGASGRVVCLIGLSGEGAVAAKIEIKVDNLAKVLSSPASFLGDLTDSKATGVGRLTLRGELGIGPFAVSHEETLRLTMVLSKENVDVDFE